MSGAAMLHEIEILEARRIAELAGAARDARDQALTAIPEAELGETRPARGEHHPAGALAFGALPEDAPTREALREAIEGLLPDIRRKLWAVMRIGCGDYARGNWTRRWRSPTRCRTPVSSVTSPHGRLCNPDQLRRPCSRWCQSQP